MGIRLGGILLLVGLLWPVVAAEKPGQASGGLPALEVDEEEPLLLEDAAVGAAATHRKGANNTSCFVCHANYKAEPLAERHARERIGCADCHGPSDAHQNDENNITPPDKMFPSRAIDSACRECHPDHQASAVQVIARWQARVPAKTDFSTVVCTDCHGQHRLAKRMVRWDKRTGRLLPAGE